jgi:hypothetical protein
MLDQDISTADARRLLSVGPRQLALATPDVIGPSGWTRRGFLQAVGLGVGGGALTGALGDGFLPNATAILGAPELPGARGVPTRDETRR